MPTPWWMQVSFSLLLASTLLSTSIYSYPIGAPVQVSRPLALDSSLSRRTPQPARQHIPKSPPPHAQGSASQHSSSSQHQTTNPGTPSPEGSPRKGPMDVDISPHGPTRYNTVKSISTMASNLRTGPIRSDKYREETKERYAKVDRNKIDWSTHQAGLSNSPNLEYMAVNNNIIYRPSA